MAIRLIVLVGVLVLTVGVLVGRNVLHAPVTRRRVERFARRERLQITPANGSLVLRYLAVTRRWRTAGLLAATALAAVWSVTQGALSISFAAAFAGWFVGAVIAELRIAAPPDDGPRSASLEPRLLTARLRPAARALPVVLLVLVGGLAAALLMVAGGDDDVSRPRVVGYLLIAGAAFVAPYLAGRRILARPQPLGLAPDVRAADDALRDRSLHVLAGSAVALIGVPVGVLAGTLATHYGSGAFESRTAGGWFAALAFAGYLLAPFLGWQVAIRSRPAGRTLAPEAVAQP